ncbi:hypothetical protein SAVIM40S_00629 [Streptomyces avidinii]
MGALRWIDRHIWFVPIFFFIGVELALIVTDLVRREPFLLAAVAAEKRKEIYTSLTGSSSGLLGFTLAAVAILAAFGPRATQNHEQQTRETALADARVGISKALLATALMLMTVLVIATVSLGVDVGKTGGLAVTSLTLAAGTASVVGLLVSGAGLTLSLIERGGRS